MVVILRYQQVEWESGYLEAGHYVGSVSLELPMQGTRL